MPDTYLHMTGPGEAVHFYHANGFPAGVYKPFLHTLQKQFDVYALHSRATQINAPSPNHKDWNIYADDLINFLEKQGKPIIAIGHSMGASSTVLAAIKRPDLFKALVLIEPAMVTFPTSLLLKLAPKKLIRDSKLVKGTANKPDTWASRNDYENYIRKFKGYRQFSKATFDAFIDHGIQQVEDQYRLVFHKEWEAHNYTSPPYLMNNLKKLDQLNIPTIAIRGKPNLFFPDKLWTTWQSKQPNAIFLEDTRYSHLFPLEGPEACMKLITEGLTTLGLVTS